MTDCNMRNWLPLLLIAILARGMVVDGYMPSEGGLQLCPFGGIHVMAVFEGHGDDGHNGIPKCPWQSVFFSAVPVPVPNTLAMAAPTHCPPALAGVAHAGLGLTGLPPTRAPPFRFS